MGERGRDGERKRDDGRRRMESWGREASDGKIGEHACVRSRRCCCTGLCCSKITLRAVVVVVLYQTVLQSVLIVATPFCGLTVRADDHTGYNCVTGGG